MSANEKWIQPKKSSDEKNTKIFNINGNLCEAFEITTKINFWIKRGWKTFWICFSTDVAVKGSSEINWKRGILLKWTLTQEKFKDFVSTLTKHFRIEKHFEIVTYQNFVKWDIYRDI